MTLSNQICTIQCAVLTQPALDGFDIVHNTENTDTSDFCMARTFRIKRKDGHILSVALLDTLCSGSTPYAVLEGRILTVILFAAIIRIDVDTGAILQHEICENMGGLHEIHSIEGGYLLYGESELFRYDHALHRLWDFSGRDIFVSFRREADALHLRDFLGWHYVLDLNGKVLGESHEQTARQ